MNISLYKCTSVKMQGEIILTYHDGTLYNILFRLQNNLTQEQIVYFKERLPFTVEALPEFKMGGGITIEEYREVPANDKVALFCEYYRRYIKDDKNNPVEYHKSKRDHLMIRTFEVTERLLITYFTSNNVLFKNHHGIGNYCKFYNQLRAEAAGAYNKPEQKFPDSYDREFEKKLTGKSLSDYWAHLRSKGLTPKKHRDGSTLDWLRINASSQPPIS